MAGIRALRRLGWHQRIVAILVAISVWPIALYAIDFADEVNTLDANAASIIVQVWVAVLALLAILARVCDARWADEPWSRAALRLLVPLIALALIAARIANRGIFAENPRFHLALFPVLVVVVAAALLWSTRFRSTNRRRVPASAGPPTGAIPSGKPPETHPAPPFAQAAEAPQRDTFHLALAALISIAWLVLGGLMMLMFGLCAVDEGLAFTLFLLWTISVVSVTITGGWLADRNIDDSGGLLLVLGRTIGIAIVAFVVALPFLLLLPDGREDCW